MKQYPTPAILIAYCLVLFSAASASAFQHHPLFSRPTIPTTGTHHCRVPTLLQKGKQSGGGAAERPSNEFSRRVPADKVLKLHGKHLRNRVGDDAPQRQYSVHIVASSEQCSALADRFQLSAIEHLEASLSLRPEGNSAMESAKGILVQGTVDAKVTQTCVRSNENFQVNLEFPLYSIVRPVEGTGPVALLDSDTASAVELNRDNTRSRKRSKTEYSEDEIDPSEMMKIQSMLEDMEQHKEDYEDVLMEDENIYGSNGMLDVGELVAQLFWLQLDPYPKKPGTQFTKFSISG